MLIEKNISLKPYNTFGVEAKAKYFAKVNTIDQLKEVISFSKQKNSGKLILGGGSNILFTKDYDGIVIKNNLTGIKKVYEDENIVRVKVYAGESWSGFTDYCVEKGWCGIENLSLIPGSVGASPVQNIGAYGVEVKDSVFEVEVIDIESLEISKLTGKQCDFGYRNSIFKNKAKERFIVVSVTYELSKVFTPKLDYKPLKEYFDEKGIPVTLKSVSEAVKEIRRSKLPDPQFLGNAGSFFKNPVMNNSLIEKLIRNYPGIPVFKIDNKKSKLAAGWMIEKCGWKGKKTGDAGVHGKQALVLVNYGNASGRDIFNLAEKIKHSVLQTFGIELEYEVNIL